MNTYYTTTRYINVLELSYKLISHSLFISDFKFSQYEHHIQNVLIFVKKRRCEISLLLIAIGNCTFRYELHADKRPDITGIVDCKNTSGGIQTQLTNHSLFACSYISRFYPRDISHLIKFNCVIISI